MTKRGKTLVLWPGVVSGRLRRCKVAGFENMVPAIHYFHQGSRGEELFWPQLCRHLGTGKMREEDDRTHQRLTRAERHLCAVDAG
jgi:hypothetical protein